jgi:hypothetical protein
MVIHDLDLDHQIHVDLLDLDHDHRNNHLFDHSCLFGRWFLCGRRFIYYSDFSHLGGILKFDDRKLHRCGTTLCFLDCVDNLVCYDQLSIHICYNIYGLVLDGRLSFVCTHLGDNYLLCAHPRCMWCTIFHCIRWLDF